MNEASASEVRYRQRLEQALELVAEGKIENWNEAPFIDEYILGFFDVVVDADQISQSEALNSNERDSVLRVIAAFDELQAGFDKNELWDKTSWEHFEKSGHFRRITTAARDALSAMRRKP